MIARRLILALFIALLISGAFTYWLSRKVSHSHVQNPAAHQYVTASTNLDAGEAIKVDNLKLVEWQGNAPLVGAFTKTDDVVGRVMLFPVAAGEPILQRQLSAPGSGTGLAATTACAAAVNATAMSRPASFPATPRTVRTSRLPGHR